MYNIENDSIKHWKYQASKNKQDPYEDIISQIQEISRSYSNEDDIGKTKIIEDIFSLIRQINVFPIIYFNKEGIKEEILSVYEKNDVSMIDNGVYTQLRNGLLLLDFLFPNLHLATTCNETRHMYDRFYNDDILKKAIKFTLDKGQTITNLRTLFFQYARLYYDTPINFSPMRAKIIFEHYCPNGGTIYDYSAGYGARMLGALCSQQNFKYLAVEPNSNTFYNLKQLGSYIEEVTGKKEQYSIYNIGSEFFQPEPESIDFIFSCPPFYKKEIYSNEITQSISSYPDYDDWLNNYVRKTVKNCYIGLKEQGVYAVDILNYTHHGKKYPLIEDWKKICEEEGFIFKEKIPVASRFRKSDGEGEYFYLFMKKEEYKLPNYTPNSEESKNKQLKLERAKYRRNFRLVGEYDVFGHLIQIYDYFNCPISIEEIKKNKKINNNYYIIYYGEDVVQQKIEVKMPIALIENEYCYSYAEIGRKLGISRQAVAQSKSRNSKTITNKKIVWLEEEELNV